MDRELVQYSNGAHFDRPIHTHTHLQEPCCWGCVACREDSYAFNDTCIVCPPGFAPNHDHDGCEKIPAEHLTWDSPWAIVPLVFSALGVTATLFVIAVFVRYNK